MQRLIPHIVAALLTAAVVASPFSAPPADAAAAISKSASGHAYKIDCSLVSGGDGLNRPFRSLAAANRHGPFVPGDRILVRRGTTCAGRLEPQGSGSAKRPIVLGAYGRGAKPQLDGGGTPTGTATLTLQNVHHWTVQDLHITNRGKADQTGIWRSGVLLLNNDAGSLRGMVIQRLRVDQVVSNLRSYKTDSREYGGIVVKTWGPKASFDGLRILHNSVTDVGRTGIIVANHSAPRGWDDDVRVAYNTVRRSRGDSIVLRGARDSRIDNNVSAGGADFWPCDRCGGISPDTANAAIWPAESLRVRVDHNEVYGTHKLGGDGVGIDVDQSARDVTVEYNYVHDNEGGGILFCGSTNAIARFNIIENNARSAFVFIGSLPANNTKIYNNTVYTKRGVSARVVHTQGVKGGKQLSFYNNLIYNLDDSGYYVWPMKYASRTNIFVGIHGIDEPRGYAEEFADPGLRDPGSGSIGFKTLSGYHPTSPDDDTPGSAIPSSMKKDFFGNTINPKKPPRGAAAR